MAEGITNLLWRIQEGFTEVNGEQNFYRQGGNKRLSKQRSDKMESDEVWLEHTASVENG